MAKSRKRMNQGKKVRAATLEKAAMLAAEAAEAAVREFSDVEIHHSEDVQGDVEVMPISWKNASETTGAQRYTRKIEYARETISRKKSAWKKAAVGTRSLTDFFKLTKKLAPIMKKKKGPYKSRFPDEATLEKIHTMLPLIDPKLVLCNASTGEQHMEGVTQYLKYKIVKEMMVLLLAGEAYSDAADRAVNNSWHDPSKFYRFRVARIWLGLYLETGSIPLHQQGKHAKRRSILSDPFVKEKCVEWIRGQKATFRSIPALRLYLRQHVLPEVLAMTTEVQVDADVIVNDEVHPLSNDALSTYLKSWGFEYKTGKYKMQLINSY